jgi:MoxR-like ATPase
MAELKYRKLFDPARAPKGRPAPSDVVVDRAPPETFLFDDALVLGVNIARATGRPLLLRGLSGVGKTSVARAVAWHEGWSYVQIVVTSRTLARDFLYQIDDLKRLQDAYAGRPIDDLQPYLVPGPLFWAFEPDYARSILTATGRGALIPSTIETNAANTVVLIDEIDKAEPDVPNNLLEPLGRLSFETADLPRPVSAPGNRVPLVVLTTNEERDLPAAFLRRCIEHRIELPDRDQLRRIGEQHFKGDFDAKHHDLVLSLAPGSPAEYLDALRACRRLVAEHTTQADLDDIVRAILGAPARRTLRRD